MRILFVLSYYYPYLGGAEYVFQRLTEGLVHRGHSVSVITTHLPGTAYQEEINGVEIERVSVPRFGDRYFFALLSLNQLARRVHKFDLIHTASNNLSMLANVVGKVSGKPVIFTCHEVLGRRWHQVEPQLWKAWIYRGVEKMIVKHPYDQYVAVSQATHRDLLKTGVDSDRAAVVYNGVDEIFLGARSGDGKLRAMLGLNEEDFIYLYFGRPGVTKGVDYLVKAAPLIQKEIPTAQLVLILAKEPLKQYERISRMARELCPGTNIHFVPPTPDREQLVRYLLDANCIVIPSITEGFGLTTVEACSLGIPVVATRAGAIPEVISGRHILIEPGSSEAICKGVVCAWKGQYDEWKPPKQFSWAKMVADYESVYKDTLERCM